MRIATDHREAILQTAARLFARKPFHEVLMDDVAEQTGIAKGTIYRYFPNKEELFAALHLQFVDMMTREVERSGRGGDPVENIRARLARAGEVIAENYDFFEVMLRHECEVWERRSSEVLEHRNKLRDLYSQPIADAEAQGLLACQYGVQTAADMLLGMMRNILRFMTPLPQPAVLAEMVMDMFLHGVAARHSGGAERAQASQRAPRARKADKTVAIARAARVGEMAP